jgi:hypothetical protein
MRPPTPSMTTRARTARRLARRGARRGVTFLEVVLGVTLMGLVATTLGATVSAVGKSIQRQRDRLGAAEVASRITLIRVDDEEGMPDPSLPIGYGEREFRWTIEERPVLVTLSGPAREAMDQGAGNTSVDLSRRIISVTVTAWLGEEAGGSFYFDADLPHARVTRLIDPLDFATHDSAQRRLDTQEDIENFMRTFMGTTTDTTGGSRNSGQRNRAPSTNRPAPAGGGG